MINPEYPIYIEMTMEDYLEACENLEGICLNCGEISGPVEPDARNYLCEECEEKQVFGIEELMLAGDINIIERDYEDEY